MVTIDKCPCGCEPKITYRREIDSCMYSISCSDCWCKSYDYISLVEAISGWNNGFFKILPKDNHMWC